MELKNSIIQVKNSLIKIKYDNLHQISSGIEEDLLKKNRVDILKRGQKLFNEFYQLGIEARKENLENFKDVQVSELKTLIKEVVQLIVDDKDWILAFICCYLDFSLEFSEFESVGKDVLEIRSGYQFIFDLFKECDDIEPALKTLNDEIRNDFDKKLKCSKECETLVIDKNDIPNNIPKSHSWWFLNQ
ncbi:unnamed protein product [Brachionus calyciflorus]|uniref:Uncharacterized protein n=1 Tax=Brachionus calyciflorus TaxID=104777 RepID=A0A813Q7W2_9BILA|nr:unnamed protein product [Brachionus calyciflorus]